MTKIKCTHCGDIIESKYSGQFVQCSCGKIYIDETEHYCRVGGNEDDWEIVKEDKEGNNDRSRRSVPR